MITVLLALSVTISPSASSAWGMVRVIVLPVMFVNTLLSPVVVPNAAQTGRLISVKDVQY